MPYRIYVTRRKEGRRDGLADENRTGLTPKKGDRLEVECDGEKVEVTVMRITKKGGVIIHVSER